MGCRNEGEIVKELKGKGISISRQEVSRLSRLAVKSFSKTHIENMGEIKKVIEKNGGYLLHIDGTVDGKYSTIITCYDSLSGIVLYATRIDTESYENVKPVLEKLKNNLGNPLVVMTDLGSQIRSAVSVVFPGVITVVCRYHFLRALGKDILDAYYPSLVKHVGNLRIMTKLDRLMKGIEERVDIKERLGELKYGYVSSQSDFYALLAWCVLKDITSYKEGTGYGYPFDLPILKFVNRCRHWWVRLYDKRLDGVEIKEALGIIKRVVDSVEICKLAGMVEDIKKLFEMLRNAMGVRDDKTPMSADEPKDAVERTHQHCNEVIETMRAYLSVADMPVHVHTAVKHIIKQYKKWEKYLFVPDISIEIEGKKKTIKIPTTNNRLEARFRGMRRLFRKHGGDKEIGKRVSDIGCEVLLFQNVTNYLYVNQMFGNADGITQVLRETGDATMVKNGKIPLKRKEREEAITCLIKMLENDSIPITPYTDILWSNLDRANRLLAP
ncbi:MAG: hypothetical protein ACK4TN_01815 [Brevinematales bacterium]